MNSVSENGLTAKHALDVLTHLLGFMVSPTGIGLLMRAIDCVALSSTQCCCSSIVRLGLGVPANHLVLFDFPVVLVISDSGLDTSVVPRGCLDQTLLAAAAGYPGSDW